MNSFSQWLEAKDNTPKIIGFVVRYGNNEIFCKTYHEARETKSKLFRGNDTFGTHSSIYTKFQDGTMRPVSTDPGGTAWHLNRADRITHDYLVDKNGRGKTNQSYLAKDDREMKLVNTISYLHHELTPNNMPSNTGETTNQTLWSNINAALDQATKEMNLTVVAQLYDFIKENYDTQDEAVEVCLMIIRNALNHFGYDIKED